MKLCIRILIEELFFETKGKYVTLPQRDLPIMITTEKQQLLQIGRNKEKIL